MIYEFSLHGNLNTPLASVYQAFVTPYKISRWCSPNNLSFFKFIGKFRSQEHFRMIMQGEDGFQQSLTGTFHEVQKEQKICFTCRWEDTNEITKVNIDFSETVHQTSQIVVHQTGFRCKNDMLMQQFAWVDCLEKLSLLLTYSNDSEIASVRYYSITSDALNALPA